MENKDTNKVKIGDVVKLKSGGPEMTVVSLSDINHRNFNLGYFDKENFYVSIENVNSNSLELVGEK